MNYKENAWESNKKKLPKINQEKYNLQLHKYIIHPYVYYPLPSSLSTRLNGPPLNYNDM